MSEQAQAPGFARAGDARFVIVGTGVAGATAALTLRAEGYDGDITLIGAEPEEPYRRPPLSKEVLRGSQSPARTLLRPAGSWAALGITLLTGTRVTSLDRERRELTLDDGRRLPYDRLLLATGCRPRRLPAAARGLPGVYGLRTLADARALRGRLVEGGSLLVVGAGLIGLEVAAAARGLGCAVTVAETEPVALRRCLPAVVAGAVAGLHESRGVRIRTGVRLEKFEHVGGRVTARDQDGTPYTADTVLLATGAAPDTELAEAAGLDVHDGILVDAHCATSDPRIHAAGDAARRPDPFLGGPMRVEHWTDAQEQGAVAARNMLGQQLPFAPVPWFWTRQYDVNLQVCGYPQTADGLVADGDPASLDFAARLTRGGRLVGAVCAGRPAEFRALRAETTATCAG